jgi:hypothetical protein
MQISSRTRNVVLAVSVSIVFGTSAIANANEVRRPTYEEAWSLCTSQLDQQHILRNEAGQRYAAGASCMLRYGYRI